MSKLTRFHYMAMVSACQRLKSTPADVVGSAVSLLLLAIGSLGSLVFVSMTIYALVGIIVLRQRS